VFLGECGFRLIPNVRRTWAPRGHTPIIRHRYRRDKVSAISAVPVSPRRRRCGLYIHFYPGSHITHGEVAVLLRAVLRQIRGHFIVLCDGGSIHKGPDVRALLTRCPHQTRFRGGFRARAVRRSLAGPRSICSPRGLLREWRIRPLDNSSLTAEY